jgi:hypothetical protein
MEVSGQPNAPVPLPTVAVNVLYVHVSISWSAPQAISIYTTLTHDSEPLHRYVEDCFYQRFYMCVILGLLP